MARGIEAVAQTTLVLTAVLALFVPHASAATSQAASKNLEWPDPKTGTALGHIKVCTVNKKNHTRHVVAAAGGAVVAWQHTWRSLSYQMVEADVPMGWSTCAASCVFKAPQGFTMLTIESEDENEVIRTLLTNTPGYNCTTGLGRSAWLGVTDLLQEGNMTYLLDGAPLRYATWAEYQPNNDGDDGQDCLRILSSGTLFGEWEDIGCSIVWGAQQTCICKRDNSPATMEARYVGVTGTGKKYWTLATPRSWEGCRIGCHREAKGRMAVAATLEDQNNVSHFGGDAAASLGLDSVWLGATDMLIEGHWNWIDGSVLADDAPWAPEQPDNQHTVGQGMDEDGLMLHTAGSLQGRYTDEFFGKLAACLCETEWQATTA